MSVLFPIDRRFLSAFDHASTKTLLVFGAGKVGPFQYFTNEKRARVYELQQTPARFAF